MQKCTMSPHGRQLLAHSGARTAKLQPRLDFVPWVMLDGERVVDALYGLKENLCKRMDPEPVACRD